jgi:Cof subfamily protein (haloacid dehalogenase superfamily)
LKTLYISDLDGTLLNEYAELSQYTVDVLNRLIKQGMQFSVATARTAATAVKMLERVDINVPVILMNGVCIYDIQGRQYIKTESITEDAKRKMLEVLKKHHVSGFLYSIDGDRLGTFYENTDTPNAKEFIKEREEKYGKIFTKVTSFADCIGKNIVYYSVSDKQEKLLGAYHELKNEPDLHIEFYRDIYHSDFWYLEICSHKASKFNAVNELRNRFGFEKITGFGDNLNDLPLFAACDESYAVENAKPEVKNKAAAVIAGNREDGVAGWLLRNCQE